MLRLRSPAPPPRRGTVLPLFCLMTVGLFGCIALAIDLGLLVVARTECQNAADAGALAGARQLNNKPDAPSFSNKTEADKQARETPTNNVLYSGKFDATAVTEVKFGIYTYDDSPNVKQFIPDFVTPPTQGSSYTAARVTVVAQQPAYFSRIFGVESLPTQASAVAVHRPRDIAMVLDMTGSMRFGSTMRARGSYISADPNYPKFGHYSRYLAYGANDANVSNTAGTPSARNNPFYTTKLYVRPDSGEVYAPNNWTVSTAGGPPCVRDFFYDPSNLANPASAATTPSGFPTYDSTSMPGAFDHNPRTPGEDVYGYSYTLGGPVSGVPPTGYVAPTYDYGGWAGSKNVNAFKFYPTPDTFADQSDTNYLGDRHPRKQGKEDVTANLSANWDPFTASGAAVNLAEYLGWVTPYANAGAVNSTNQLKSTLAPLNAAIPVGGTAVDSTNFRDATWEKYGYDLDVDDYFKNRGTRDPRTALSDTTGSPMAKLKATKDKFQGYSMGPGYWGKTFFMWPPDPRWGTDNDFKDVANPLTPGTKDITYTAPTTAPDPTKISTSSPVMDTKGNWICDWRRRFFLNANGTPFDPSGDPNGNADQINKLLVGDGSLNDNTGIGETGPNGRVLLSLDTFNGGNVKINYPAVLKWLKSPPMALPPNLRAGRVVYYTSIPDDVTGGSVDAVFWKKYIDYVLNPRDCGENYYAYIYNRGTGYDGQGPNGYEKNGWPEGATAKVTPASGQRDRDNSGGTKGKLDPKPYLNYLDNPNRPRSQMWFGPITMMAFLASYHPDAIKGNGNANNAWAGTVHESQTWQLKAGVNSVLTDIRNNHPNDAVGLAFFSTAGAGWNRPAVAVGQEWGPLKDALYYPRKLVDSGNAATPTNEFPAYQRYNSNDIIGVTSTVVPNGQGGTDPNTGMAQAFNLLTPCPQAGIRGPASLSTPYYSRTAPQAGRRGASKIVIFETDGVPNNSSDSNLASSGGFNYYTIGGTTNNSGLAQSSALAVVDQIVKNQSAGGLSSDTSPARVYSVGFGDLFGTGSPANAGARQFLLDVQKHGGTSAAGDSAIPDYQIITGAAEDRIVKIRKCFERIMQSGVQVTLIE